MKVQTNNNSPVTLYGAGGHCKVVIDILETLGIGIECVVDDNPLTSNFQNYLLLKAGTKFDRAIITIGNCQIRRKIANSITASDFVTVIHPSAIVSPHSEIGKGTVIMHGAIVQSCAKIGDHCILNTKSSVGHDVTLHDFVHVASGSTICGGTEIGEGTWLGAGSVVKQGIHIGKNCMIGAGAVVVNDIPDNVVAYGNPCRVIRSNP